MEKTLVNIESINAFKDSILQENEKLIEIIEKMNEESIKYSSMVNNKSGNLYKEVMIRELQKEKENILNDNEEIKRKFTEIIKIYEKVVNETSKSVGA